MLPWHTTGIYDHPEDFGLSLITDFYATEVDADEDVCSGWFDVLAIWKDAAGHYFIGHDSNCECVKPFENTHPDHLAEVGTRADVREFVRLYYAMKADEVTDSLTSGLPLG